MASGECKQQLSGLLTSALFIESDLQRMTHTMAGRIVRRTLPELRMESHSLDQPGGVVIGLAKWVGGWLTVIPTVSKAPAPISPCLQPTRYAKTKN